jgi:hypothetical protein
MPTGGRLEGGDLLGIFVAVAAIAVVAPIAMHLETEQRKKDEERRKTVAAFEQAHKATYTDTLKVLPPNLYADVEVRTPKGPEICKITMVHVPFQAEPVPLPSDCRPK